MAMSDDEQIEAARRRQQMGNADAIDAWRLKAQVRKDARAVEVVRNTNDAALVETAHSEAWAVWFNERFDEAVRTRLINGFGEALGQSRIDMRNEFKAEDKKLTEENRRLAKTIEDLRVEVAELRGELKVLRAAGTSKLWRPD